MRAHLVFLVLVFFAAAYPASVMAQADDAQQSADCTFDDGKQVVVRFNTLNVGKSDAPPMGKPWAPGGTAMTLFTEAEVTLAGRAIPTGGYTMYVVPGKKDWTLIVSRNTNPAAPYDEGQDLARGQMDSGQLGQAEKEFKVFFGHLGPKICELNLVYGKTRAWVEFRER